MKTKIIGHRGAAGLALENTLSSIKLALSMSLDAVEFDIRLSKDKEFVVCHDASLARTGGPDVKVKDLTAAELSKVPLSGGETVPTLRQVLSHFRGMRTMAIIELKVGGASKQLIDLLDDYKDVKITIASFKHDELAIIRELRPAQRIYLAERTKPLEIVQKAVAMGATGIDLNFWLLNPLTYWQARRAKLDIMVYTVNNRFFGWFLKRLYPGVLICTNYPDRFLAKH